MSAHLGVPLTSSNIRKAVTQLLEEGKYPLFDTYDDAGLELEEYISFVQDVLSEIKKMGNDNERTPD